MLKRTTHASMLIRAVCNVTVGQMAGISSAGRYPIINQIPPMTANDVMLSALPYPEFDNDNWSRKEINLIPNAQ